MRRIWLTLSLVLLVGGATALAQDAKNTGNKNVSKDNTITTVEPQTQAFENPKADRKSDPRAISFLKDKVDKTMYNLVSQGVRDAVVRMQLQNSPQFGDLTVIHYWQASPHREFTDVAGLDNGMTGFKQIIANQLGDHIRRALLLPASMENQEMILSLENDGDLVKVTSESRNPKDNERHMTWYTNDGRLVRGVTEGDNPVTGPYEARRTYDLQQVGNQWIVTGITTRIAGRPTQIRLFYEDRDNLRVLTHATVNSSRGTMSTKFDISFNKGIDAKVFQGK